MGPSGTVIVHNTDVILPVTAAARARAAHVDAHAPFGESGSARRAPRQSRIARSGWSDGSRSAARAQVLAGRWHVASLISTHSAPDPNGGDDNRCGVAFFHDSVGGTAGMATLIREMENAGGTVITNSLDGTDGPRVRLIGRYDWDRNFEHPDKEVRELFTGPVCFFTEPEAFLGSGLAEASRPVLARRCRT
jgi:hypothetical protein